MWKIILLVSIILLLGGMGYGQSTDTKPQKSMMYCCETMPFLSVSVNTLKHDGIPQTQIKLTDPLSRDQGMNLSEKRIPKSHYEDIVIAPDMPDITREHAVEVCDAQQGEYELTVYEHGDEEYSIAVVVNVAHGLSAYMHSREGRIRRYRFLFTVKDENVYVTWLGKNGQPQFHIGDQDW